MLQSAGGNKSSAYKWVDAELLRYQAAGWLHGRKAETVVMVSDASRFSNPGQECLLAAVSLPRESVTLWAPPMAGGLPWGPSRPRELGQRLPERGGALAAHRARVWRQTGQSIILESLCAF